MTMPTAHRPGRLVGLATGAVALMLAGGLIAGCGGGGAPASASRPTVGGGSAPPPRAPPRPQATPSGVRTFTMTAGINGGQDRFRVTVYSLRRSGRFLTLNAGVVCERGDDVGSCNTEMDFDLTNDYNTFNGVRVLDPAGEREYSVARDSRKRPYVSELQASMASGPTVQRVWARYAAPPAATQTVDLLFPYGGPRVSGVPITEGGGVDPAPSGSSQVGGSPAPFDRPPESTDASGLDLSVSDLTANLVSHGGSERAREARGRRTLTLAADVLFGVQQGERIPAGGAAARRRRRDDRPARPGPRGDRRIHRCQGLADGPLRGIPPTGRALTCRTVAFFLFEDERLVCERVYFDAATILSLARSRSGPPPRSRTRPARRSRPARPCRCRR